MDRSSYDILCDQKENEEYDSDKYGLPVPLQEQQKHHRTKITNVRILSNLEYKTCLGFWVVYPVMYRTPHRSHNRNYVWFFGEIFSFDAKQALELLKSNGDGSSGHEPDNGGVREEVDQEPESATY